MYLHHHPLKNWDNKSKKIYKSNGTYNMFNQCNCNSLECEHSTSSDLVNWNNEIIKDQSIAESEFSIISDYINISSDKIDLSGKIYDVQKIKYNEDRNVLLGWLYLDCPFEEHEWTRFMCLPREIRKDNDKFLQFPLVEINNVFNYYLRDNITKRITCTFYYEEITDINIEEITGEINIKLTLEGDELITISSYEERCTVLTYFNSEEKSHILDSKIESIRIIKDVNIFEVFFNYGEYTICDYQHQDFNSCEMSVLSEFDTKLNIGKIM